MKPNVLVDEIEREQLKQNVPAFRPGDTLVVQVEVKEGNRTRTQAFEGLVIAKRRPKSINAAFTLRKISDGEGVERVFQVHSPAIKDIKVKRQGKVRKAKLYHQRALEGKAARIKERLDFIDRNNQDKEEQE